MQMHCEDQERDGIVPPSPAWQEGANFELISAKLRQRWPAILRFTVLCAVIGTALAILYVSTRPPTYSATGQVLIENTTLQLSERDAVVTQLLTENSLILTEMELVRSGDVLKRVVDGVGAAEVRELLPKPIAVSSFGLKMPGEWLTPGNESDRERTLAALRANLGVNRVGATQVIAVTARAVSAEGAARIANQVVNAFVDDQNQANALVTTSQWLRERIKVVGPTLRVVSSAIVPSRPDGLHPLLLLMLAAIAGGILGAAAAIAFALLNRRLVSAEQIVSIAAVECFGYVPRLRRAGGLVGRGSRPLHQLSQLSDVLRRARLAALERAGPIPPLVGVTSCRQGEGKSMISFCLAQLIAAQGQRALLVDASHDRKLTRHFASGDRRGLTEVLSGDFSPSEAISPDIYPFLDFMPHGEIGRDIDMHWPALRHLLSDLEPQAPEWAVVDLPALAPIVDVRAAAQGLTGILLVVEWGRTQERQLREALSALGPARAKLLGVIVNRTSAQALHQIVDTGFSSQRGAAPLQTEIPKLSAAFGGLLNRRGNEVGAC